MRTLREERGGILALSAVIIPVFLLLTALVLDVGRWYTYKRALQNRADAGALAAGYEYLSQLPKCPDASKIAAAARQYAGAGPGGYNEAVNVQSRITVTVNPDGVGPCEPHDPDDGIWTDVTVKEADIGTVAGAFGVSLPSIAARARVAVNQITDVNGALPFVSETGDRIECVWAQFVRARDGDPGPGAGFSVLSTDSVPGLPNTIGLKRVGNSGTWTGKVDHLILENADDDVAVRYYAGTKDGNAPCSFATSKKSPLPHDVATTLQPVAAEWINVYDTGPAPETAADPPVLRQFKLVPDNCGGPGFIFPPSDDPGLVCRLGFSAEVDTGKNKARGEITVDPTQPNGSGISSVSVPFDTTGDGGLTTVTGTIEISPNATRVGSGLIQDYTQVGRTFLSVSWTQAAVDGAPCATSCSGTFEGETVSGAADDVQQAFYVSDPLGSTPMISASTTLSTDSWPGSDSSGPRYTDPFSLTFRHQALDMQHVVLVRDSIASSGNRTLAAWCGGGPWPTALSAAIAGGCQKGVTLNTRDDSCSPTPNGDPIDCVQVKLGDSTAPVGDGIASRLTCSMQNNWGTGGALPSDGDPRWAYIPLTGYGRMYAVGSNAWLPVEGFVRLYVTGWGGGGLTACSAGVNDPPPRGFDSTIPQLWGHLVSPITLDGSAVAGDVPCDLTLINVQCKPTLVR